MALDPFLDRAWARFCIMSNFYELFSSNTLLYIYIYIRALFLFLVFSYVNDFYLQHVFV